MNKKIIALIVAFAVIAGGSFYAGMTYQKSQVPVRGQFNRTGGIPRGGGFTTGTILSKDETSLSIELPGSAGSKIIFYTPSTPVMRNAPGSTADLLVGQRVMVVGTANTDGSVTAQSIQLGTSTRPFGGGGIGGQ